MRGATETESVVPRDATRRSSRWVVALATFAMLLVVGIIGLPWIISNTRILNGLLKSGLAGHEIEASIGAARLGWLTPASLHDIQLKDQKQRWSLDADRASSQLTLLQLLWSGGDLGEFHIKGPTLIVNADRPWPEMPKEEKPDPSRGQVAGMEQLRVSIEDGRVLVRTTPDGEPDEFVSGANLVIDYREDQDTRTVVIHRGRLVDRIQLTKEMCDLGLKFVLPILADVTWVKGSLSVELDRCMIPLGDPRGAEVAGRLHIHSIESGLQKDWLSDVSLAIGQLGDVELPESVRLADESIVTFNVRDGRVEHENLEFGLPEVSPDLVVSTRGSVGMDKSLDLVATLPPFGELLGDGPIGEALRSQRLKLPIQGTLDKPQVSVTGHEGMLEALAVPIVGPLVDGEVTDEDLQKTIENVGDVVGELWDGMRKRREERLKRREEEDEPSRLFPRLRQRLRDRQLPP